MGDIRGRRLILAPGLCPPPDGAEPPDRAEPPDGAEGLFYLSWPGWEEYLRRRLDFRPGPAGPSPLSLPDDGLNFPALDQLAARAAALGAELWRLLVPAANPGPAALAGAIRRGGVEPPRPILSDRAYLALWSLAEYRSAEGEALRAEAARKEKALWAALKGEEPPPAEAAPVQAAPAAMMAPDRRSAHAWRCWRRLAAPLLRPDDIIVPLAAEDKD